MAAIANRIRRHGKWIAPGVRPRRKVRGNIENCPRRKAVVRRYKPIHSFGLYRGPPFCKPVAMPSRLIRSVAALFIVAAVAGCEDSGEGNEREAVTVVAEPLRTLPETASLEAIGTARAARIRRVASAPFRPGML